MSWESEKSPIWSRLLLHVVVIAQMFMIFYANRQLRHARETIIELQSAQRQKLDALEGELSEIQQHQRLLDQACR